MYFRSLLRDWAELPSERRRQVILATGERWLGPTTEWLTRLGRSEVVANVDHDVARKLEANAVVAAMIDGSLVSSAINEQRLCAGLAALGAFLGSDSPKTREVRELAEKAIQIRREDES